MEGKDFQNRVRDIFEMLSEMAEGNLLYRLPADPGGDDIDKISTALNSIAGQFQLALKKSGSAILSRKPQITTQLLMILDIDLRLINFNREVIEALSYDAEYLLNKKFDSLLSPDARELFESHDITIKSDKYYHNSHMLNLLTFDGKIYPVYFTISRLLFDHLIVISSTKSKVEHGSVIKDKGSKGEGAVIQELHDYIMANLERPLPTLKELSRLFKTNDFRLKDSFRHFFNTSIYQFYNDERLKRAHLIIQQSDHTLKAVAIMSGFNNYITFSKAFKKRFGYAPSVVKRGV